MTDAELITKTVREKYGAAALKIVQGESAA